jgi:predicted HTH domain antitoxin
METVNVELPTALLRAANLERSNLSQKATRLLALELHREDKVSLGRAAELYSFEDLENERQSSDRMKA